MTGAIEVVDLRKSYGTFEALRGINFSVAAGESVALLGPNGAGKSSTVEILEGYRRPTSGRVSVLGVDPSGNGSELRTRIGIVLQEAGFPPELTVVELINAWRRFFADPMSTEEVLVAVGLEDRRDVRAKSLSGGEHRRLDLALALTGKPELLFLDEPTTGFDPAARRAAWELIENMVSRGMTLMLTSHYLDEAQRLADRILIVNHGEIVAEGTPDQIGGRRSAAGTVTFDLPGSTTASDLPPFAHDASVDVAGRTVRVTATDLVAASHAVTTWALEHNLELAGFQVTRPSLEDIYLSIIGEGGDAHESTVSAQRPLSAP
jgi:ABC-2 type transport system ATP-binding protein